MRSGSATDLSSLARLAQNPDGELRPLLLRVQTQTFVSAPHHDAKTVSDYETLALGLIPLVPDDVLASTAALLRTIPDAPLAVMAALADRLGMRAIAADLSLAAARRRARTCGLTSTDVLNLLELDDRDIDVALAASRHIALDGQAMEMLVRRGQAYGRLARILLERPSLSAIDRAALYGFASSSERERIRRDLETEPQFGPESRRPASDAMRARLVKSAERGDDGQVVALLRSAFRLEAAWRLNLDEEAGRELFVLALVALKLGSEDCVRLALTFGRIDRSAASVRQLARLVGGTSASVASFIVAASSRQERPGIEPSARAASAARLRSREPALRSAATDLQQAQA